jgi:hypothetical protein
MSTEFVDMDQSVTLTCPSDTHMIIVLKVLDNFSNATHTEEKLDMACLSEVEPGKIQAACNGRAECALTEAQSKRNIQLSDLEHGCQLETRSRMIIYDCVPSEWNYIFGTHASPHTKCSSAHKKKFLKQKD